MFIFELISDFYIKLFGNPNDLKYLEKISNNKNAKQEKLEMVINSDNINQVVLLALANNPNINKNILIKIVNHNKSYKDNGSLIYQKNNNIYNKVESYNKEFRDRFYFLVSKNGFLKKVRNQIPELIKNPVQFLKDYKMNHNLNNFFHVQELIQNIKDLPYDVKIKLLKELGIEVDEKFQDSKNKDIYFNNNTRLINFYNEKLNPNIIVQQENIQKNNIQNDINKNNIINMGNNMILTKYQKENYYDKLTNLKAINLIDNLASVDFIKNNEKNIDIKLNNYMVVFQNISFKTSDEKFNALILFNDLIKDLISLDLVNPATTKYFEDKFMKEQMKELTNSRFQQREL